MATQERTQDPADAVATLREVDAGGPELGRAERRGVGVGDGLEAGQPGGQDEQPDQEGTEGTDSSRRDEPEGADGDQAEADHDGALVPEPARQHAGWNGHQEVTHVVRELHQGGLGLGDVQRILEVLVQHVDHAVAQPPEQEEGADERERHRVAATRLIPEQF